MFVSAQRTRSGVVPASFTFRGEPLTVAENRHDVLMPVIERINVVALGDDIAGHGAEE